MTNETHRWIEAGKTISLDPKAVVSCPSCQKENLVVTDSLINSSNKFERILTCPLCDSKNIILLNYR
jgi:transposase-like protein